MRKCVAVLCACLCVAFWAVTASGAKKLYATSGQIPFRVLRHSGKVELFRNMPSKRFYNRQATATISISYTNFTDDQKAACEYAKGIWEKAIASSVTINIKAEMKAMEDGVLGGAAPSNVYTDFKNIPEAGRYYVTALAESLAGENLNGTDPEINMSFNTQYNNDYYYGTDGKCPSDKMDFVSLVLHEICHGLGFISGCGIDSTSKKGYYGWNSDMTGIMDTFYQDKDGKKVTAYTTPSAELASLYTSNAFFFEGPNSGKIPIYAPATFSAGSSLDHVADSYNGTADALMTWSMGNGEVEHNLGTVVPNMFKDMGWKSESSSTPSIGLSATTLTASATTGTNAANGSFEVYNSGSGTLNYTITDNADWLSCSPTSGDSTGSTDKDTITVSYSTSSLAAGTHTGTITVTDTNAGNNPQNVIVTLTVSDAAKAKIDLSTSSLTPSCETGSDATAASFTIGNTGDDGSTLSYAVSDDASWISCSPESGSVAKGATVATIAVTYDTDALTAGTHTGTITVTDSNASNSPQTISVSLTVTDPAPAKPQITLSTTSIDVECKKGQNADTTTFTVTNGGDDKSTLNYSIVDDVDWLSCAPLTGALSKGATDTVTVTYSTASLVDGVYSATITVADDNASNSPQMIGVVLTVVSGYDATIGAKFEIKASACVEAGIEEFDKKPKVFVLNGHKKAAAKVLTKIYPAEVVQCEWKKPLPAGTYELFCQPAGYDAEIVSDNFEMNDPEITAMTVSEIGRKETKKGVFYDIKVEMTGTFFGGKKAKVFFEYTDPVKDRLKKKNFKMLNQTYDLETGASTYVGIAKRVPSGATGAVVFLNKVGEDEAELKVSFGAE